MDLDFSSRLLSHLVAPKPSAGSDTVHKMVDIRPVCRAERPNMQGIQGGVLGVPTIVLRTVGPRRPSKPRPNAANRCQNRRGIKGEMTGNGQSNIVPFFQLLESHFGFVALAGQ